MTESYLAPILSNTLRVVGATSLSGIVGEPISGPEGVDEVADRFVAGIFLRFAPGTLATFAAAEWGRTTALAPHARSAGPAGGAIRVPSLHEHTALTLAGSHGGALATAGPTRPATRSAR